MGKFGRLGALALVAMTFAWSVTLGACKPKPKKQPLTPAAGVPVYQERNLVRFDHGISVNIAGGNLLVERTDLSLDTRIGTWPVRATYNSANGEWRHNFEMSYVGSTFIDDTGAVYDLTGLGADERIPGSTWVRISATQIKTLGGLVYHFSGGKLEHVNWKGTPHPRLNYHWSGNELQRIEQCKTSSPSDCLDMYTFTYGPVGLTRVDDRAGRRATFSYVGGMLRWAKDGLDIASTPDLPGFRYLYDGTDLISVRNSELEETVIAYDTASRAKTLTLIGEGNPETSFAHTGDTALSVTVVTDPAGYQTRYRYDANRRLHTRKLPTGEVETHGWGSPGGNTFLRSSFTDTAGLVTTWNYDVENVEAMTLPGNANTIKTTFAPYSSGDNDRANPRARPVLKIEDDISIASGGVVEERQYYANGNGKNQLEWIKNGEGETTSFSYTSAGHIRDVTSPSGAFTEFFTYGDHGHAERIVLGEFDVDRTFDAVGNELTGMDRSNATASGAPAIVSRAFDADRNLTQVEVWHHTATTDGTDTTTVTYRSDGLMSYIDRPFGGDTSYDYDQVGRLATISEKSDGVWRDTVFEYDVRGLVTSAQKANGMRSEADYDESGRVTEVRHLYATGPSQQQTVSYEYDDSGRLISKTDSAYAAPETVTYNVTTGRISTQGFPGDESIGYTYDERSRVTTAFYVDENSGLVATIVHEYDLADRITETRYNGSALVNRTYDVGRVVSETFGNGLTRSYEYRADDGEWLTAAIPGIEDSRLTRGSSAESFGYTFWWAIAGETDATLFALKPGLGENQALGGGQRSGSVLAAESAAPLYSTTDYEWDALRNFEPEGGSFSFNPERNRVWSGGGHGYYYDYAGYAVIRDATELKWTPSGRLSQYGSSVYSWDAEDRLTSFTSAGVTWDMRFGGAVRQDSSGDLRWLDLGFAKVDLETEAELYRHLDFRGNVLFVTEQNGNVVRTRKYDGYGVADDIGSADDDRSFVNRMEVGFGGSDPDLQILGARVYDRDIGRFLSPDPIHQVLNQYQYASGNPIWYEDSSGLAWGPAIGGALLGYGLSKLDQYVLDPPDPPAPPPPPGPPCGCDDTGDDGGNPDIKNLSGPIQPYGYGCSPVASVGAVPTVKPAGALVLLLSHLCLGVVVWMRRRRRKTS